VPPVSAITTEEGQRVAFDRSTYQFRELTKKLPPQRSRGVRWPGGFLTARRWSSAGKGCA
jgi:hypothetical protein